MTMLLACQMITAQTVDKMMQRLRDCKNVTCLSLPKALLGIAKMGLKNEKDAQVLKKIDEIKIVVLDEASRSTRRKFRKEVNKLDFSGYSEMLRSNDDGENVRIMSKGEDDYLTEVVFLIDDDDDSVLICAKGKISPDDVQAVIDSGMKMAKKDSAD